MGSDSDDDHSYSFQPLGGSLHVRRMNNAASAPAPSQQTQSAKPAYQSTDDIANKYLRKVSTSPTPPAAAAEIASPKAAESPKHAANSAPKFGMVRPSASASAASAAAAASSPASPDDSMFGAKAMASSDLDDSIDSIDPGSRSPLTKQKQQQQQQQQQPGGKRTEINDSFFTESPFQPKPTEQAAASARAASPTQQRPGATNNSSAAPASPRAGGSGSSSPSPTRYSYLDPKNPARIKRGASTSDDEAEESAFSKQIRPLGSSLWNKAIDTQPQQQQQQQQQQRPNISRAQSRSSTRSDEERKSDVRLEPFSPSAAAPRSRSPTTSAAAAASASPAPSGGGGNQAALDQSRVYNDLLERWQQDQEELQHLREAARVRQQQQQQQNTAQQGQPQPAPATQSQATDPLANPLLYFSASACTRPSPPPLPDALRSPTFELDAVGALQLVHSAAEKESLAAAAAAANALPEVCYTGDVKMDEVLADHKRLRQRLRAAQHAIEALASQSEPGSVLGQALGGAEAGAASVRSRRSGYAPAIQVPNALSLSQYAHLPPARAVLKLLNRLEREEESYLSDRGAWKKERSSLLHQIQTLYTDLKHLTALSHQAQQSEQYHRQREAEQEEAIARLKADREAERARWAEIEQQLKNYNTRERVRFNQEVAALERNDMHYKEKYDAVLAVLRRYESERKLGVSHPQQAEQALQQQRKLHGVVVADLEQERAAMLATLAKQEAKFRELQQQVQLAERQKDALIREQRAEIERETQRRISSEQQLLAMQHSATRNLDVKLEQLNSFVNTERQSEQRQPTVQHAAAEIANQYARVQAEESLYEPVRRRSRSRSRPAAASAARARYVDSNDESGHSVSPVRRTDHIRDRHCDRERGGGGRSARSAYPPTNVGSAQQILSLLPPNANVRGDIELVLPASEDDEADYSDDGGRRQGRPRYARPTYSSQHAAAIAHQLYYPPRAHNHSRSRSRSASRPRERERERERDREYDRDRDVAGSGVRREVDRRVQFESRAEAPDDAYALVPPAVRRSRSQTRSGGGSGGVRDRDRDRDRDRAADSAARVGPAVNGHSGVTVRVVRRPATAGRLSAGSKAAATKQLVRQAYTAAYDQFAFDRYGRISDARYV